MHTRPNLYIAFSDFDAAFHQALVTGFLKHQNDPLTRKSHFFGARHENIYINADRLPMLQTLIDASIEQAHAVLGNSMATLHCGHWFNAMQPGHETQPHTHDDDDERLSGVYYLQVPAHSGQLLLRHQDQVTRIQPEPGMWVFFPADIEHAVSLHRGDGLRLSVGMNFGPG